MLGMALANQFDVKEPQDLLRGLSNVLSEYELLKEDSDRPKIVRTFSVTELDSPFISCVL